jgi:nucleoside-diphosphate-sugar epimerase
MTQPLQGRRILVTGGATGIGAAAVQVLSEAGASVVASHHRTPPADQAGVSWVQCDVRDSAAVDAMVTGAAETLGGLDVLLRAAGLWQPGIPGQITGEDIDYLVDTNLKATIFTNQAAHAVMRKSGGRIINFGSGEAVMGSPISAVYAATKARSLRGHGPSRAHGRRRRSRRSLWRPRWRHPARTVFASSSAPRQPISSTNRSRRRSLSAEPSEIRSRTLDRHWFSSPARDPASLADS